MTWSFADDTLYVIHAYWELTARELAEATNAYDAEFIAEEAKALRSWPRSAATGSSRGKSEQKTSATLRLAQCSPF